MVVLGYGDLLGVTENRRAPNPWLRKDTIDPQLGVIRIDDISGKPIATIWNFAIHGTCLSEQNMKYSSEIMGKKFPRISYFISNLGASSDAIESLIGGIALFINSDAGDIDPTGETCSCNDDGSECTFDGAPKIAQAVQQNREKLNPSSTVSMTSASQIAPFGPTK